MGLVENKQHITILVRDCYFWTHQLRPKGNTGHPAFRHGWSFGRTRIFDFGQHWTHNTPKVQRHMDLLWFSISPCYRYRSKLIRKLTWTETVLVKVERPWRIWVTKSRDSIKKIYNVTEQKKAQPSRVYGLCIDTYKNSLLSIQKSYTSISVGSPLFSLLLLLLLLYYHALPFIHTALYQ